MGINFKELKAYVEPAWAGHRGFKILQKIIKC